MPRLVALLAILIGQQLFARTAAAQIYLFPNENGQISLQLSNDPTSAADMTQVVVTPDASVPTFLQLAPTGAQPTDISIGNTGEFDFLFSIPTSPQSGAISIQFDASVAPDDLEQPNQPITVSAFVDVNPPKIASVQSGQGQVPPYGVTNDPNITITVQQGDLAIANVTVYENGAAIALQNGGGQPTVTMFTQVGNTDWYWVQACDIAGACNVQAFGFFPPGTTPSSPSSPPAPPSQPSQNGQPGGPGYQPPPPPPPSGNYPPPTQPPNAPNCPQSGTTASNTANCGNPPNAPPPPGTPIPPPTGNNKGQGPANDLPGDPNSLQGPAGAVTPGQMMTYTLQFENVGDGTAIGVYVNDVLDPSLDETTLSVSNMFTVTYSSDVAVAKTATTFPWSYDSKTRTVTVMTGNSNPSNGGSFTLSAKLRTTTSPGTIISNQGLVYFPTALQPLTPTNTVVSAVPLPTQIASIGVSSGVFMSSVSVGALLTAGTNLLATKPVSISILASSATVTTSTGGIASINEFLTAAPGNYSLQFSYAGDNFYYLPSSAKINFTIAKKQSLLQAPYAVTRTTGPVSLGVTLTDTVGNPLVRQDVEPKTVYLELVNSSGTATPLSSALLSGTSVQFQFALLTPYQSTWTIRTRFNGDSRYLGSSSTGTLRLIDLTPPAITIISPQGGEVFRGQTSVAISYAIRDNIDLAPSATAYLVSQAGDGIVISSGQPLPIASLKQGTWTFLVQATDWAGNFSSATTPSFQVYTDALPPRTSLVFTDSGTDITGNIISTETALSFAAIDDQSTVGDSVGVGVSQTLYSINGGPLQVYSTYFFLVNPGPNTISFHSVDFAGNVEATQTQTLIVDVAPPVTNLSVDGLTVNSTGLSLVPTDFLGLASTDTVSGVAQTLYTLDGATVPAVYVSTFSLPVGTHTLVFQSVDNVGNVENARNVLIYVLGPPGRNSSGQNLGVDSANLLWSIYSTTTSVSLAHNNSFGVFTASTTLSGADPAFPFSVFFDTSGNTYAIGSSIGGGGNNLLAIYAITAAGDGVTSLKTFDSGYSNNNLVFGAVQPGWIVGAVQTSGPVDPNANGERSYSMAIWKYTPSTGLIQLMTTYTRAGFDVGTSVAQDGEGNLWISGFSESPNPRSPRAFDLALWKYAPDGKTLLAGPFIREGYLSDFVTSDIASVLVTTGPVFVTAPRGNAEGTTNLAITEFAGNAGAVVSESAWQPSDGSSAFPSALLLDNAGRLVDAGGFDYGASSGTLAGIWRYGLNGALLSAAQDDAGGARGAAYTGSNLWLSVDGSSSPFSDSGETTAAGIFADIEPPRTNVTASSPSYVGSQLYVGLGTQIGFTAVDDRLVVGDGLGVGTTVTMYAVDSSSFTQFTGGLTISSEGVHGLSYYSIDLEGNAEVIESTNVAVDLTPPVSSIQILGSSTTTIGGAPAISSATLLQITAIDPVSNGVTSGVGPIFYVVDQDPFSPACANTPLNPNAPNGTCANEAYDGSFSLAPGTHTVYYFAEDNVGNQETENSSTFTVLSDVLPPRTAFNIGTPTYSVSTSTLYASDATIFGFTAVDDLVVVGDDAGSGVAATYLSGGTTNYYVQVGTFTLGSEGLHTLSYYSVDLAGNVEVTQSTSVAVDITPPITTLQVSGSSTTDSSGNLIVTTGAMLSLSAIDPISNGVASGVGPTYYVVDQDPFSPACEGMPLNPSAPNGTCANEVYDSSFTLTGGTHTLYFFSEDNIGNQEGEHVVPLIVTGDVLPPRTSLSVGPPTYFSTSTLYATDVSSFSLNAVDDLAIVGDDAGVGVAKTFISIDSSPFVIYGGTFTISTEGAHSIEFYSVDLASNVEVTRSSSVAIDLTPPITSLQVLGVSASSSGVVEISSDVPLALSAVDPISNGVASGVAATYYVVDVNPFSPACESTPLDPNAPNGTCANEAYNGSFTLSGGTHTVYFFSEDNTGNQELVNVSSFTVPADAKPPRTSFFYGAPSFSSATLYATEVTTFGFTAADDLAAVGDGLGLGVAQTLVSVDGQPFFTFVSPFALPTEGAHTLQFYSMDMAGNTEAVNSTTVALDLTSPYTQLQVSPSSTTFTLTAIDPVSNGVASGVAQTYYVVDTDPFSPACESTPLDPTAPNGTCANEVYDGPFTLSGGTHTIYYFSEDNVGNQEVENATAVMAAYDVLPPRTYLNVGPPSYGTNPTDISTTTLLSLTAFSDAIVVGDDAGPGVAATYVSIDSASYALYTTSFTIAAPGPHTVSFYSVDVDSHVEVAHSSSVYVDVFAPALALTPPAGSTVTVSTPTLFAVYADTASGISTASVRLVLDGVTITTSAVVTASSATYTPPYALAQGTHTFSAAVADNLGNAAMASSTFLVDTIPPVTTLAIDGLQTSATNLLLVSTDTIGFVAVDTISGVAQTLYALNGSTTPIVYTSAFSLAAGTYTLAYHSVDKAGLVEATHTVALSVRAYDVTPPTLTLAPPSGSTVTITTPTITAVYVDTGAAVNTATLKFALDGVSIATHAAITASSATYIPTAALSQGTHTITASIADLDSNVAYATSTFFLDSIPPVTTLQVDGLTLSATSLVLVTTDTIGFVAVDSGTGVSATYYSLSGGTQTVYVSTFSLAAGSYTLAYHSVDRAGNVETAHTVSLTVRAAVVAPPTLTLTPANGALVDVATPTITAIYVDTGSPVVLASFVLTLDGTNVTAHATIGASTATYVPTAALAQGSHTVVASIANAAGLHASATSTFYLDTVAPVTSLQIDGLTRGATSLVIVTTDTIGLVAVDTGSGVAETLYSVNSTTYAVVYTAPFSLTIGTYTIDYHSVDKAGNVEKTHAVYLDVLGPGGPFSVYVRFEPFAIPVGSSAPYEGLDVSVGGSRDASMIVPTSLKLTAVNGVALTTRTISILSNPAPALGEENGQPVLEADVSRASLVAVLPVDAESAVTVAGSFKDGTPFTGTGRVRLVLWWVAPRGVDAQFLAPTGAGLYLPSGAVPPGTEIAAVLLDTSAPLQAEARADAAGLAQLVLRGTPFALDSTAWFLSRSAALSLPYDPTSLGFGGTLGLVLAYWNEGSQTWTPLASLPDPVHDKVTASVSRLGVYQVASSQNGAIVWSSPASFGLRGNTAAPNPSRGGAAIDFQLQTGLADSVQLDVYTANGAHVLSQSVGAPSLRGGQYYYDYVWPASGVTTGNYAYVFTAHKAGMPDVSAGGRVQIYR